MIDQWIIRINHSFLNRNNLWRKQNASIHLIHGVTLSIKKRISSISNVYFKNNWLGMKSNDQPWLKQQKRMIIKLFQKDNGKYSKQISFIHKEHVGELVMLSGWIQSIRKAGSETFLGLRDSSTVTQLVLQENISNHKADWPSINTEDVVCVKGKILLRPPCNINAAMKSGYVEVFVNELQLLNHAKQIQIPIERYIDENIKSEKKKLSTALNQEVRLRNRHLDLRGLRMQRNIRVRAAATLNARVILTKQNFLEIETPVLFKSTPEGAREFLVPTRKLPKGSCYALVQSPQQYKQLLMAGGIERYFQFAKCFRDEMGNRDRQPEFTQLDIEMSFATESDVRKIIENVVRNIWSAGYKVALDFAQAFSNVLVEEQSVEFKKWQAGNIPKPLVSGKSFFSLKPEFPILTYDEAIEKYGSDKPDRRFDIFLSSSCEPIFKKNLDDLVVVRSIVVPKKECHLSNAEWQNLLDKFSNSDVCLACISPNSDLTWKKILISKNGGQNAKARLTNLTTEQKQKCKIATQATEDVQIILSVATYENKSYSTEQLPSYAWKEYARQMVCNAIGHVRSEVGTPKKGSEFDMFWVVDFPLFEIHTTSTDLSRKFFLKAFHHPFTMPQPNYYHNLRNYYYSRDGITEDILKIKGQTYDLVCNGSELGGGSVRIHTSDLQKHVFMNVLGMKWDDLNEYFGHLLTALDSGCPPHAGIALGMDRVISIMCNTPSVSDVIAFPKSTAGNELLTNTPTVISDEVLEDYNLQKISSTLNKLF